MRLASLLLLIAPACAFFDDDDHGHKCLEPQGETNAFAPQFVNLVDPSTLQCRQFSDEGNCNDTCQPCPGLDIAAPPSWGACGSSCEGLGELACQTTGGCRVARDLSRMAAGSGDFLGCYAIDMLPAPSVPCSGLDAWSCSRHDDCEAYYSPSTLDGASWQFAMCVPELHPSR